MANIICSFFKTRKGIVSIVVVVILIVVGAIVVYYVHRSKYESSLEKAKHPLLFPKEYLATTRRYETTYKSMKFEDMSGKLLGDVLKCGTCISHWTFYVLNSAGDIALDITRENWTFQRKFYVTAQWPWHDMAFRNTTWQQMYTQKYTLEYDWSGSFGFNSIYHIFDGNNVKVASSSRFRLEFGKTLDIEDTSGTNIGKVSRPGFYIGNVKWTVTVKDDSKMPSYIFGVMAALITLQEEEENDD